MKAILILMDTLNRHMLKVYNPEAKAITPNIDRLAERSMIMCNHWIGSAPCMPARRDILTGRLNFLERGWGSIEPFDVTFVEKLRNNGVFCHITTDHYHYTAIGGEGYLQQYDTWDLHRGQESDVWVSNTKDPENIPERYLGQIRKQYQWNRSNFKTDADYPTPRTFASAVEWLRENEGADDFFLTVEVFDPHEPFDATDEFKALYPHQYDGPVYEWPKYAAIEEETPEALEHLQNLYCATLTMADKWLGKLLDEVDRQNLWDDTLIILTSDHGHMLGEHGLTGKNLFHAWNEMSHIPLLIHQPGGKQSGVRSDALTQNIDIASTLLEYFNVPGGVESMPDVHGKSWTPLFDDPGASIRDYALYGWFGKPVNITDGRYTYFRAAKDDLNSPLYMYMSMLTTFRSYLGRNISSEALSVGNYLPHAKIPVYRIDASVINARMPAQMRDNRHHKDSLLFDIQNDYSQKNPLSDSNIEKQMIEALIRKMEEHDAPSEQFMRLGLR
ncbi:MAG: sulfatase [Eubacteriales bacterium]